MSYQNHKPYIQANTVISFINSVRAFAIRNPSPEEQSPQSPNSYEPQVNPTATNAILNHHEPQSPVSNLSSSLLENFKPGRVMEETREHELEISLEQTPYQQEPYEDEPGYQTPPEHNEQMDMTMDSHKSNNEDKHTLPYSYFPEPSAEKYRSMLTGNWSVPPAPSSPVPGARRRNTAKRVPLAPSSSSPTQRTKRYNSKEGIPSSPPLSALKSARKRNVREGIPHAPPPSPTRIPKRRKSNGMVEGFGGTWPPDGSRIISLLTDSSPSSRAASPAPASPTSDSDVIITHATPIRHREPPPPSKSSSLSLAGLSPLPMSSSPPISSSPPMAALSPLPISSSPPMAVLSPLPVSSPPLIFSSPPMAVLSPPPMSSSPPMAALSPLPISTSPPMAVLSPFPVSSSPPMPVLSPLPISTSPPIALLSPLKSSSLSPNRLSPPLKSISLSPASSKFDSSSSSSSSDELTITNTPNKRSPHHPHYPSPKRQRVGNPRLKTGPWGDKDRMLLVKSLQNGIDFITLGQKMRRDVDDVFEKFSDVVAAGLYKCSTKDSSTQTDEMAGEER